MLTIYGIPLQKGMWLNSDKILQLKISLEPSVSIPIATAVDMLYRKIEMHPDTVDSQFDAVSGWVVETGNKYALIIWMAKNKNFILTIVSLK